jgi:hypothetical protein
MSSSNHLSLDPDESKASDYRFQYQSAASSSASARPARSHSPLSPSSASGWGSPTKSGWDSPRVVFRNNDQNNNRPHFHNQSDSESETDTDTNNGIINDIDNKFHAISNLMDKMNKLLLSDSPSITEMQVCYLRQINMFNDIKKIYQVLKSKSKSKSNKKLTLQKLNQLKHNLGQKKSSDDDDKKREEIIRRIKAQHAHRLQHLQAQSEFRNNRNIIQELRSFNSDITETFLKFNKGEHTIAKHSFSDEMIVMTNHGRIIYKIDDNIKTEPHNVILRKYQVEYFRKIFEIDAPIVKLVIDTLLIIKNNKKQFEPDINIKSKAFALMKDICSTTENKVLPALTDKYMTAALSSESEHIALIRDEIYDKHSNNREYIFMTNLGRVLYYKTNNTCKFTEFNFIISDLNLHMLKRLFELKYEPITMNVNEILEEMHKCSVQEFLGESDEYTEQQGAAASSSGSSASSSGSSAAGSATSFVPEELSASVTSVASVALVAQEPHVAIYDPGFDVIDLKANLHHFAERLDSSLHHYVEDFEKMTERENLVLFYVNDIIENDEVKTSEVYFITNYGKVLSSAESRKSKNATCEVYRTNFWITNEHKFKIDKYFDENKNKYKRFAFEAFLKSIR